MLDLKVFYLMIPLVVGILLGCLLRGKKKPDLSRITLGAIVVLIFSLGFSIGSNNQLLASLPRVGLNALVIMFLAVSFSVLFVLLVKRKMWLQ